MPSFRVAAAQSISTPCAISANVVQHCRFIIAAANENVDVLLFPELSLSGYELDRLVECVVHPDDSVLSPIRELARSTNMTVVVGAPVASDAVRPSIAAVTFFPTGATSVYCKRFPHSSEEGFVTPGPVDSSSFELGAEKLALAICADTGHERHAQAAAGDGATVYLAGVLVSDAGYETDSENLQRYASRYGFAALMANHGGPSGQYISAGKSAFWSQDGRLVIAAPGPGTCLVVASKSADSWTGEFIPV